MATIREKIQKLLSLATSPNENEAKAALLKAKELMIKHKMSEEDFQENTERKLISVKCEDVKWTTDSGETWIIDLCKIIATEYLCTASWLTPKGTRTHTLMVTGIGEDPYLCKEVITYAVEFVRSAIRSIVRKKNLDKRTVSSSYAQGFILGLELAFEEQKEEHPEWGLVAVKPQEVQNYEDSLGSRDVRTKKTGFNQLAFMQGQNDGLNFNIKKVIGECQ